MPKNIARAIGAQSSSVPSGVELMTSLAHRVPDFVMYNSYGADDFVNSSGAYHKALLDGSNTDTVEIKVTIQPHSIDDVQVDFVGRLPLAILHNFEDKTTFARRPVGEWTEQMKAPLELELERALGCLYRKWSATHKKLVVP